MSLPFGGHPKLSEVLDWLSKNGCTISHFATNSKTGRPYKVIRIKSSVGKGFVHIVDPDLDDLAKIDRA